MCFSKFCVLFLYHIVNNWCLFPSVVPAHNNHPNSFVFHLRNQPNDVLFFVYWRILSSSERIRRCWRMWGYLQPGRSGRCRAVSHVRRCFFFLQRSRTVGQLVGFESLTSSCATHCWGRGFVLCGWITLHRDKVFLTLLSFSSSSKRGAIYQNGWESSGSAWGLGDAVWASKGKQVVRKTTGGCQVSWSVNPHILSARADGRTSFHPPLGSGPGHESSAETASPFDELVKCRKGRDRDDSVGGCRRSLSAAWGWRDRVRERLRVTDGKDGSDDGAKRACVFSPSRLGRTLPLRSFCSSATTPEFM